MSETGEAAAARPIRGSRAYWVLAGLLSGLVGGVLVQGADAAFRDPMVETASIAGGFWLDALKMTVIPLIVALLVTGVAKGVEAARAGQIAGRAAMWFIIVCTASAVVGAVMMPLLTSAFPLGAGSAAAFRAGLASVDPAAAAAPIPAVADFFREIIPENVVAAAANGDVLPLVVFALLFALAISRIAEQRRRAVIGLFDGIADALLVIIGWVLWLAPLGVFALGFGLSASAGGAAFAALAHYIVLVCAVGLIVALAAYPIAVGAGRVALGSFGRAMLAPQSVAISTRSSLACLPAMLAAARVTGVREEVADVALPMAVALFRATGPAMNVAVAFYVAHLLGIEPSWGQIIAATAVGAVVSYGSVSLPGEISFIASIAPIAMALGVPIAPLALLVAVEVVPDIVRTFGNVTMDVAVTTAVDRRNAGQRVESDA